MTGARAIRLAAALAAIAVATGFLIGYPAEVAAATSIVAAACVSLITIRELAARAGCDDAPSNDSNPNARSSSCAEWTRR